MISDNDITSSQSLGVTKKLLGQFKAFNNLGYDTYHLCFKDEQGVLIHKDTTTVIVKKQLKMYLTYIKLLNAADRICLENKIDMCYIRYPLADFAFMKMIKKLHNICKVVIEIPTYPYDEQCKTISGIFTKYKVLSDKRYRKKLKDYNIKFSTVDNEKSIFGVPCINITNGIDLQSVEYVGDKLLYDDSIRIIAVALVQRDHGYDRVIEGLKNYYSTFNSSRPEVFFNIVGDGPESPALKKMVKDYNLSRYVIFHGKKFGKDLDKIFLDSNLAVSGVGGHRSGLTVSATLKTREYCARGIPFICSLPDVAIPPELGFYKLVDSSEEPVDIEKIVEYYNHIRHCPEIREEMRKFAEENLTWEPQLKKVLEEIKTSDEK